MNGLFADRWAVMHRWWSVRVGTLGIIALAGLPALSDQFPNIAPSLITWFPRHGAQVVPIIGAVIAIAARVISQEYVMQRLHALFGKKDGPC
jgi:hypothetical protein